MNLKLQTGALIVLALIALVCSRTMFFFINDPEGPNLFIVLGLAALIWLLFLLVYFFRRSVRK